MMRDEQISVATMNVVSRFGLKKTTMADIADEAKISRQTLYNAYPNKEAVLQATVKFFVLRDLEKVRAAWSKAKTLEQKLDAYFELGPIAWFESIRTMPDAAEILEGISDIVEPALEEAHEEWIKALASVLEVSLNAKNASELADFIFSTAKSAKYSASGREQLIGRLTILKDMVLTTYGG